MKTSQTQKGGRGSEFKGVVKRMTGKLTNDPEMEREGREEMLGQEETSQSERRSDTLNPDPHRRG